MELELNRIKYVILNILDKHGAKEPMRSMSCEEIQEIENYSAVTTIYKHIRILEKNGYVTKGAKIERANGYIITKKGLNALLESAKYMED